VGANARVHACVRASMCVRVCACACVRVHVRVHVCARVRLCVCVHVLVRLCFARAAYWCCTGVMSMHSRTPMIQRVDQAKHSSWSLHRRPATQPACPVVDAGALGFATCLDDIPALLRDTPRPQPPRFIEQGATLEWLLANREPEGVRDTAAAAVRRSHKVRVWRRLCAQALL
jgi:hypothetical protein